MAKSEAITEASRYTGRCLCGEVRYSLDCELGPLTNCHCQFCRRAHGSAFSTVSWVPSETFQFTAGEAHVSCFSRSGGGRYFCSLCGTRLFSRADSKADHLSLIVSSLDQEPPAGPVAHFNIESKAGWYEILDDCPQFETLPAAVRKFMDEQS